MRPTILLCLIFFATTSAQAGTWVLVGQGDCPGPRVGGNSGKEPDFLRCDADFVGKTALCYTREVCNPGCEFVDVPTTECRGGMELADLYTCVADPKPQP